MTPDIIARLIHPRLVADQFVPTKYSSAKDKADFGNSLLEFIAAGFPERKFTHKLYDRLMNCFGHIAHYNKAGFAGTWFSNARTKTEFVEHLLGYPCWGDPEFTFSDLERAVKTRVLLSGVHDWLKADLAAQVEAKEKALLAKLLAKHGGSPVPTVSAPQPVLPKAPPIQPDISVVRKRLEREAAARELQPTLF